MGFWDKFIGKEGGFWKRYWKIIAVVSLIYILLTLGIYPSHNIPETIGAIIGVFGLISLFFYIYYKIKTRKRK